MKEKFFVRHMQYVIKYAIYYECVFKKKSFAAVKEKYLFMRFLRKSTFTVFYIINVIAKKKKSKKYFTLNVLQDDF